MLSFEKREFTTAEPAWFDFLHIVGHDDEGEAGGGETEGGGESGAEGGENGEGGEGEGDDESALPDNIKAILKKERDLRAAAEKKAKILEKNAQAAAAKIAGEGKSRGKQGASTEGNEEGGEETSTADPRYQKMVDKFREQSLASKVGELAKNFADPSDVWRFLDTDLFDYTQDDDDPSQVVWDESEIRAAIKALAKEKPYLLKPSTDGQGGAGGSAARPSGPKFAGRGSGRQTGGLSEAEMAQRVPALRTAVRAGNSQNK